MQCQFVFVICDHDVSVGFCGTVSLCYAVNMRF